MPRYVNADWLLERAVPMGWSTPKWVSDIVIEDAPTADVVEVVRCKDCIYMTEHYDIDVNIPYYTCWVWDNGTDYDGFCHLGERKEIEDAH